MAQTARIATSRATATAEATGKILDAYRRDDGNVGIKLAFVPSVTIRAPAAWNWAQQLVRGEWVEAAGELLWLSRSRSQATVIQAVKCQLAWAPKPRLVWHLIGTVDEIALEERGGLVLISYEHRRRRPQLECRTDIETALRAASINGPAAIEGTIELAADMSVHHVINGIREAKT
jgi:hypothetical protein